MILEQSKISQLMVLTKIFGGKKKPSEIGKDLGLTLQGVIYHLKILKNEGLVNENNEITKKGFEFLYTGLNDVRNFVHDNISEMDSALSWEAISDQDVKKGERVWLTMQDGYLHASRERRGSEEGASGVAQTDSMTGDTLAVSLVTGLVGIKLGTVEILVMPNAESVKDIDIIIAHLKKEFETCQKCFFGVIGEAARTVAKKGGFDLNFEYAALYSAFEAATRGESTLILVSQRRFHFSLSDISSLQMKNPEIGLKIVHLE